MQSTMQDVPLTLAFLLRHGLANFGTSKVVTCTGEGSRETTFREIGEQSAQLANALTDLGIATATGWPPSSGTTPSTSSSYLAIPGMGAVLHTLNVRLFPGAADLRRQSRRGPGDHRRRLDGAAAGEGAAGHEDGRARARARRDGDELAGMGPDDLALRGRRRQPAHDLRLAHRSRRAIGGGHVLHQRHDRQPEGRRLLPPVGLPALDGRLHGQRVRRQRAATGCCRWSRCSTPTPGGCRTPRGWPAPT